MGIWSKESMNLWIASIGLGFFWVGWSLAAKAESSLALELSPPVETLVPDAGPVTLTVRHLDGEGNPAGPATIRLRIRTPDENPWLSTDFPVVENTLLLDQELVARGGEASVSIVLPIRGTYTVAAEVTPGGDHPSVLHEATTEKDAPSPNLSHTWQVTLSEHPHKIHRATWLLCGLALVGAVCGLILGREYRLERKAALSLFLGCLSLPFGAETSWAHGGHGHAKPKQVSTELSAGGLSISLVSPAPRVGELSSLRISWTQSTPVPDNLVYDLEVVRIEDGLAVVQARLAAPSGEVTWQSQLFDGTEYQARVKALSSPASQVHDQGDLGGQGAEFPRATLNFEVEPVAPPAKSVLNGMVLLMGVFCLGMALAFWMVSGLGPRRLAAEVSRPA